ncbi:MAG: hypothetical protein QME45_06395 [Clostridiales bacterium]|nr:hypothetical protein [Clostridiales bacterium]HBM80786.1 hypothetical protein [Clostridiaceae bacterium]
MNRYRNMRPMAQADGNYNSGNPNGQQPNMNNFGQLFNNMNLGQIMGQLSQMMGGPPPGGFQGGPQAPYRPAPPRDPRLQILQAMKPFLNRRRGAMIDGISQLYSIAKIIRGTIK